MSTVAKDDLVKRERPYFAPGWYKDLSNDEYHGSFGTSSSQLKTLVEHTPAHLDYERSLPHEEPTAVQSLGSAFHTLTLEPHREHEDIFVLPEFNLRKPSEREEKALLIEEHKGKAIIKPEQYEKAKRMAESARSQPNIKLLLDDLIVESSVYWWYKTKEQEDDTEFKQMVKVRPDGLPRAYPVIVDLKSTEDASYTGFQRYIQRYMYHLSAAMYLEGVNQCTELLQETKHFAYTKFVLVLVENEPPYLPAAYELSQEYIEIGKLLYRRAMRTLQHGRDNDWPGFPEEIRVMEPPTWANRLHTV